MKPCDHKNKGYQAKPVDTFCGVHIEKSFLEMHKNETEMKNGPSEGYKKKYTYSKQDTNEWKQTTVYV